MAKKKAKAAPKKSRSTSRKPAGPSPKLHAFFRKLYGSPELMDKFTSGSKGRQEVLDKSNLSAQHKEMIKGGCVPDIIRSLVGAPAAAESETYSAVMIDCHDELVCSHPQCKAFSDAAKKKS